jgi:hypothetical protein
MNDKTNPSPERAHRDLKSALLLIAIGGGVVWGATDYQIGELARMGPGYFPLALGLILIGLGALLLAVPAFGNDEARSEQEDEAIDVRGWALIVGGVVSFIVLGRYGGMVPATFALVFLSALSDRGNTIGAAALLAAVLTVVAVILFSLLLGVQFPLFVWGA